MLEPRDDEFYIGYLPKAPLRQGRHTKVVVFVHLLLSMAAATLIVWSMRDPGPAVWEDAKPKQFAGVFLQHPYPLIIDDQGHAVLLVDFGKRGAQHRLADVRDGQRLTVSGYPLLRDARTIVELAPESDAMHPGATGEPPPPRPTQGRVTLRGEIVDSKCFMGAMKPGEGKTHKACATRCISGGIPPMLVCWDQQGRSSYYLLSDEQGGPVGDWLLPLIGESVEVTGDLGTIADLPMLKVVMTGIRRL